MPKLEDEVFTGVTGRNGVDPPFKLIPGQCREAQNVIFGDYGVGRKRGGTTSIALTGGTAFGSGIQAMAKFVVDEDVGNNELFAVDGAGTPLVKRLAGGSSWADVTLTDNIATSPIDFNAVSFNGKLFCAYDSAVNRLHVYDPADSKLRRVGLGTPAAPSVADTGSGSYAATIRYYKVTYLVKSGSDILRRSQLSTAQSFTPSGTGTAARVTKPASISEDETHWEVYGSADDDTYFLLSEIAVGTTTYDDSTDPADYTGDGPPLVGTNVPPPSAKYLLADDARIIMAGAWETSAGDASIPSNRRIWWTALLGTNDIGDDERVPDISGVIDNFIDVEEPITGLGGPLYGSFYAFSYNKAWKFIQTGNAIAPYLRIPVGNHGCIDHKTIILAEDRVGNPALYWLSANGPRCVGIHGIADLTEDIEDIWDDVNLDATTKVAHGAYYPQESLVCWWVATGASQNTPDEVIVFDIKRGELVESGVLRHGWARWIGDIGAANASVLFADTFGASMSAREKIYLAKVTGTDIVETETGLDDDGTDFQAFVDFQEIAPWGPGKTGQMSEDAYVLADAASSVTLQLSAIRDFGVETLTSTADLTPTASETKVRAKFEDAVGADMEVVKFRLGDSAATEDTWAIDSLTVPVSTGGRDGAGD